MSGGKAVVELVAHVSGTEMLMAETGGDPARRHMEAQALQGKPVARCFKPCRC